MSWDALNLAFIGDKPPVAPSLGGLGLVYPGRRHLFSGPPESAKTLAAYCVALATIREGGRVIVIDLEMGQWDARDRLRDLGATDTDLAELFYVEPDTPATSETIAGLVALDPTLVIIDASAGAYSLQGLDDNKRQDVEYFAAMFIRAFWLAGITTLLLDHVVKSAEGRGRFAVGSERKVGSVDVHLGFEPVLPLRRGGKGLYRVVTHKDRLGYLTRPRAAELELVSDSETHAITWAFNPASDDEEATGGVWKPTLLMGRVLEYVQAQKAPVTRKAVCDNVSGRREWLVKAIDALVAEDALNEEPGARGAKLLTARSHLFPVPTSSDVFPGTTTEGDVFPRPSLQGEQVREQVAGTGQTVLGEAS